MSNGSVAAAVRAPMRRLLATGGEGSAVLLLTTTSPVKAPAAAPVAAPATAADFLAARLALNLYLRKFAKTISTSEATR